ncbi:hypothetical protein PYW07_000449 [Mythimna separata]|uniref:BPTI/Kunitz inhibitor domain-containing protein n=1 Tax=Mythimna separata TaxID=271217 RepID=A0AAD7Z1K8_MYTSE|nr:hypothetical protein PYW07_000449 [Mythimna separata]
MVFKILLVYVLHIVYLKCSELSQWYTDDDKIRNIPYHLRKINYNLICRLQPNGYPCDEDHSHAKFYFDIVLKTCSTFYYNECEYALNQFDSLNECNSICYEAMLLNDNVLNNLTRDVICRLQPDSGTCNKYFPMYYFDISTRLCKGFSYSGCEGNFNRFETELECKSVCNEAIPVPDTLEYFRLLQ